MKSFSQRKGLTPVLDVIQTDSMNETLRNSIWNALDVQLWSTDYFIWVLHGNAGIEPFSKALWFYYFKEPIDSMPDRNNEVLEVIRKYFFSCEWFQVYDFLEFILTYYEHSKPSLIKFVNNILEHELSAYRFVSGHLTDITNAQELEMLEHALADSRFAGVTAHIKRGFELYTNRKNPDYRNSIKESISSVEAMARIIADNPKATLGDALKSIEKRALLHPALKEGFMKLYGYTNDEGGIRHAMMDEPNLTAADARYFLLSCTSFVNYLKAQLV